MALKLKTVKGRGYETYNSKEVKKERKKEANVEEAMEEVEEFQILLITHKNKILRSNFPNVEVYIINQQNYNSRGL